MIVVVCIVLLVMPLFFGAARLDFPWPYVVVIPVCIAFVVRAAKRRIEIEPDRLTYVGTTGFSNRSLEWGAITRAEVRVIDTRVGDFASAVLLIGFRWISLLFYGREHIVLEIETSDFELLRLHDTDTREFAQLVGEISPRPSR